MARLGFALATRDGRTGLRRGWRRWAVAPLVVLVTAGLVVSNTPLLAGLQLAKPAMRDFADDPRAAAPASLGPFGVEKVERFPGGVRFRLEHAGLLDGGGYAYSPAGPPPRIGADRYQHISGPWYVWVESW